MRSVDVRLILFGYRSVPRRVLESFLPSVVGTKGEDGLAMEGV